MPKIKTRLLQISITYGGELATDARGRIPSSCFCEGGDNNVRIFVCFLLNAEFVCWKNCNVRRSIYNEIAFP